MLISTVGRELSFNLRVLNKYLIHFPASIVNSKNKAKPESDVTLTDKETLNLTLTFDWKTVQC